MVLGSRGRCSGLIVVEEASRVFKAPEGFEEIERRDYDDTEFVFLRALVPSS